MESDDRKTIQMKITVTPEEYAILEEFARNQGKPISASFMFFVREANVFNVLKKTNKAYATISGVKASFRDRVKNALSAF